MKKFLLTLAVLPLFMGSSFSQNNAAAEHVKDRLVVKFKQEEKAHFTTTPDGIIQFGIISLDRLNASHQCTGAEPLFKSNSLPVSLQNVFILTFKNAQDIPSLADQYSNTGLFEYVHPDYIGHTDGKQEVNMTPNEPAANFKLQWGLYNDGSFTYANGKTPKAGADINIKQAWDITTGDANTIIAVVDGGINKSHPEFSGRLWVNSKETAGNGVDDDNNGFKDDVNGWNFTTNTNDIADAGGHGTNVASIIGATGNNSVGWVGVNWKCKLMILNHTKPGTNGFNSTAICNAITYAADNGAKIITMSLGFTGTSSIPAMQSAIDYAYGKKILVVASMGNDNTGTAQAPCCMNHVMAVGATNVDDSRCVPFGGGGAGAAGSNFNSYISVVAPGNWIVGCVASGTENYSVYNSFNGTSQSTPFVTGVASLIYALNPSFHPDTVKRIIERTAADQVGVSSEDVKGWDKYMGWGRLDAYKAVKEAQMLTGISHAAENSNTVKVYPNPFQRVVHFSFDAAAGTSHTVIISDVLGNEIKRISDSKNHVEVRGDDLANGLYFYKIISGDNTVDSGKLIVSH